MLRFGIPCVALLLAILVASEVQAQKKGKPNGAGQQAAAQKDVRGKANAPGQQVAGAAHAGVHGQELAAFVHQLMQANGIAPNGPQGLVIQNQVKQAVEAGLRGEELAAFARQRVQAQRPNQNAQGNGQAALNGQPGGGRGGNPGGGGAQGKGGGGNAGGGGRGKGR
jgi:hypothetical protein